MPNVLSDLEVKEVSLVDRPANAETNPLTGEKIPRARVALVKRDEPVVKGVKYLVSGKDTGDHLPYTGPDGKPDHKLMGAAWAALTSDHRGKPYEGPNKEAALARLKRIYEQEGMDTPGSTQKGDHMTLEQIEKKQQELEATINAQKAQLDAIAAEKSEVEKMSKKHKAAFGNMTQKEKDDYMAADTEKRKSMMEAACKDMEDGDGDEDAKKADAVLKAELATRDARIEKAETALAKANLELAAIQKRERLNTFISKAEKELPNTSGSPLEKGEMLMKMADSLGGENGAEFVKMLGSLKAADAAIATQMREKGTWGGGVVKAETELASKATEISKRDKISIAKAYTVAAIENPELYKMYEQEKRQQRGQL